MYDPIKPFKDKGDRWKLVRVGYSSYSNMEDWMRYLHPDTLVIVRHSESQYISGKPRPRKTEWKSERMSPGEVAAYLHETVINWDKLWPPFAVVDVFHKKYLSHTRTFCPGLPGQEEDSREDRHCFELYWSPLDKPVLKDDYFVILPKEVIGLTSPKLTLPFKKTPIPSAQKSSVRRTAVVDFTLNWQNCPKGSDHNLRPYQGPSSLPLPHKQ